MYRAQVIKAHLQRVNDARKERYKNGDTTLAKSEPITKRIDWLYADYLRLCGYTGEKPIGKGKWLLQQVEPTKING